MAVWKNSTTGYGRVSIIFHWLSALAVFSLFGVGLHMVELNYYDPLYREMPWWHKSIGLTLLLVTLLRLLWKFTNPKPEPVAQSSKKITQLVKAGHGALYCLLVSVMVSGYLISTADGRPIDFFGLINVPALTISIDNQEDIAGIAHFYLAWILVLLALGHGLMALKHHLINKDRTLTRMLTTKKD